LYCSFWACCATGLMSFLQIHDALLCHAISFTSRRALVKFREWLKAPPTVDDASSLVFVVQGTHSAGKTVLMSLMMEELDKAAAAGELSCQLLRVGVVTTIAAGHFFDAKRFWEKPNSRVAAALCSVAHQIVKAESAASLESVSPYEEAVAGVEVPMGASTDTADDEALFRDLVHVPLGERRLGQHGVVVFLDALDEMCPPDRESLVLRWLGGKKYPFPHESCVRFVVSTTSEVSILLQRAGQPKFTPNVRLTAKDQGQVDDLRSFAASIVTAYFDSCGGAADGAAVTASDVSALAVNLAERSHGSFFWLRLVGDILVREAESTAAGIATPLSVAAIGGMFPEDEGPMLRYYVVHAVESAIEDDSVRALDVCLRALRFQALLPDWVDAETVYALLHDGSSTGRVYAKRAVDVALRTLIESQVDDARVHQAWRAANGVGDTTLSQFGARKIRFQPAFLKFLRSAHEESVGDPLEHAPSEWRHAARRSVLTLLEERRPESACPEGWHDEFAAALAAVMMRNESGVEALVKDALCVYGMTATLGQLEAAVARVQDAAATPEHMTAILSSVARTFIKIGNVTSGAFAKAVFWLKRLAHFDPNSSIQLLYRKVLQQSAMCGDEHAANNALDLSHELTTSDVWLARDVNRVIDGYAKSKPAARVDEAMRLVIRMKKAGVAPNVVTFNTLISACANAKPASRVGDAMVLLGQMEEAGLVPDDVTFNTLITACANAKSATCVDDAMALLKRMEAAGVVPDVFTFTALITACAKANPTARVDDAMKLFKQMNVEGVTPNVRTFTALITACANAESTERVDDAMKLFEQMNVEGVAPNVNTFTTLIRACANAKPLARVDDAMKLLERMDAARPKPVAPNVFTFNNLIMACANAKPSARIDEAMKLLERMVALKVERNDFTFTALILACANAKLTRVDYAKKLLERMDAEGVAPNIITFNNFITACTNAEPSACMDEATRLLERMDTAGVAPNEHTLPGILKCCSRAKYSSEIAERYFRQFIGHVRLSEHVERELEHAVGRERAAVLRQWAIQERPDCVEALVRQGGGGAYHQDARAYMYLCIMYAYE
jgi:pentatricopeptide repeat protein